MNLNPSSLILEKLAQGLIPGRCEGCGACCGHASDTKWIEVTQHDAARIASELLQPGDIEPFAMRQKPSGDCVALGDDKRCLIYDSRPTICRTVERGDGICLEAISKIPRR